MKMGEFPATLLSIAVSLLAIMGLSDRSQETAEPNPTTEFILLPYIVYGILVIASVIAGLLTRFLITLKKRKHHRQKEIKKQTTAQHSMQNNIARRNNDGKISE
jgi:heme/copper-type cytochrome/quinol oxidase subunit 2